MLVSHSHKFITISIPKTGTRSLRSSLCTSRQHRDGVSNTKIIDIVGLHNGTFGPHHGITPIFKQHSTFIECKRDMKKIGCDITSYFTFSVARNPWDRYVSYSLFVKLPLKETILRHPPQWSFLCDDNELLAVDHVANFGNIQEEINMLCQKTKVDKVNLPILNQAKARKHYKTYYTDDLVELVREKESKIIDLMGYTYD